MLKNGKTFAKHCLMTYLNNKTVIVISGYVIGWFVNYSTVECGCLLNVTRRYCSFLRRFDRKYWPVGQAVTLSYRAGGLIFKSQAGQIGHRVANGWPPLRHFFKSRYIQPGRYAAKNEPCKFVTRFDVITPE